MNCPRCGERVKVTNSRTVDSGKHGLNQELIGYATRTVGWYTPDWVVRQRQCRSCPWKKNTIEVLDTDLKEMFKLVATGEHIFSESQGGDND